MRAVRTSVCLVASAQGAFIGTAPVSHNEIGPSPRNAVASASARSATTSMVAIAKELSIATPGKFSKSERMASRYGGFVFEPEGIEDADFSYDDLQASMIEMTSYTRGDTCEGTVLGFEPNGALVDIGVKSSAYVNLQEMALVKPGASFLASLSLPAPLLVCATMMTPA